MQQFRRRRVRNEEKRRRQRRKLLLYKFLEVTFCKSVGDPLHIQTEAEKEKLLE